MEESGLPGMKKVDKITFVSSNSLRVRQKLDSKAAGENRPTYSMFSWGRIFQSTAQQKEMFGTHLTGEVPHKTVPVRNQNMTHQVPLRYFVNWSSTFP
jgi:hypothetical protein